MKKTTGSYSVLKEVLTSPKELNRIAVPDMEGYQIVQKNNIMYIEADRNYSNFQLSDGKKIVSSKTIGDFEKLLISYEFVRIHRSYLVNLSHIERFSKRDAVVILGDGSELEVARNRKEDLLRELGRFS